MDRLDKETLFVFLGTLAVPRDALEVNLEVTMHEMFTGQAAFCLPQLLIAPKKGMWSELGCSIERERDECTQLTKGNVHI